jgi:hypothetical protein
VLTGKDLYGEPMSGLTAALTLGGVLLPTVAEKVGGALRSGYLQANFEAARRDAPGLTTGEFLAGGGEDSLFRGVVDSLLGPASATMLRTGDSGRYVEALRSAYHDFRTGLRRSTAVSPTALTATRSGITSSSRRGSTSSR